ncbi:DUF5347 family protein [Providencia hangzhouensis]|uniref:DUF5347 family protein n=1 Tax=Providencia hangzhouensis TaxID=3031799 RepID=UPI0034DD1E6C
MNTDTPPIHQRAIKCDQHREPFYDRAITYTLDEKIDGLNQAAKLRGALFKYKDKVNGKKINQGLIDFINELNDVTNNRENKRQNKRVIGLIYFLADIKKEKHHLNYDQLDNDEQIRLVEAINQLKAINSILPNDLAIK